LTSLLPTTAPSSVTTSSCGITMQKRSESIISSLIFASSNSESFDDPGSPQAKALDWILNSDVATLCPGADNLYQRYALAVLYYSTGGDENEACIASQAANCSISTWLSEVSECSWGGIVCDNITRVTGIHLDKSNLTGSLPEELSFLTYLQDLDLEENNITGSIPVSLGELAFLKTIDIDNNALTGSLPVSLFNAHGITVIDLDSNKLSGQIPTQIGLLNDLYYIQLDMNAFTGPVPSQLASLTKLEYISLFGNQFTSLPAFACEDVKALYADCDICSEEACCTACLASAS
jgi:Leucine-rich repeat (LRR) protein